ncbi:unnamed protein product [Parajaminaea phylloscopi]
MADTASLYSTTDTLVDVPRLPSAAQSDVGPIHVTVYTAYDRDPVSPDKITRAGFPASRERGQASSSFNPISALRKRLVTQFPVRELRNQWEALPDPQSTDELDQLLAKRPSPRATYSLWAWERSMLVGVHTRARVSIIEETLFKAIDVRSPFAVYPSSRVISCPAKLQNKAGEVQVDVKWASLLFCPPEAVERTRAGRKPSQKELDSLWNRYPALRPGHKSTTAELLHLLYTPPESSAVQMQKIVEYLESRGGLVSDFGEDCRATTHRTEPRQSPRYHVIGVFPKPLLDHFKRYRDRPLGTDTDDQLFFVRTADQEARAQKAGDAGRAEPDPLGGEPNDVLAGWGIQVVEEPFHLSSSLRAAYTSAATIGTAGAG